MRALSLLLVFAACDPSPETDPDQAFARAEQAIRDHDAETAHTLLAESARRDHIPSLKLLLKSYDRGFGVPGEHDGTQPVTLPVSAWAGQRAMTGFRFIRAVSRGARAGDPAALLEVARSRASDYSRSVVDGDPAGVVQDRLGLAQAAYQRVEHADVDRLQLAWVAQALGDEDGYRRHLDAAAAAGDPMACTFQVWFHEDDPQTTLGHVAGVALYLDRVRACAPDRPLSPGAFRPIRDLRAQLDLGNPNAAVALDSLRQLGVFDRHPELAAVIDANP